MFGISAGTGRKDNSKKHPARDEAIAGRKSKEAAERNEAWAALPVATQLQILDSRLGKGVGAAKQRAKLAERANKEAAAPKTPVVVEAATEIKLKAKDRRKQEKERS